MDYKIQLGVDLKVNDIRDRITQYNKNTNNAKLKLGIKLDTDDLKKQINNLNLGGSGKGKGVAIPVNTQSLETSLKEVKSIIADIKTSIGSLDSGAGMKSLLSSINQISSALDKATGKFDELNAELKALSSKDFNINLGIDMGKKGLNTIGYGRAARKQVIPELESQIKYLENLFGGQQATMNRLASKGKNVGFDIFTDFGDFNSDSAIKKMEAMEKYINSLKKLATIDNVSLDGFNEIHKDAAELINDITGIENAVDKADDVPEKLKNFFGGSIDGENLSKQLDSIVVDLGEIKTVLQGLSSGVSIDGLTQSFEKLSNSIEQLVQNCVNMKMALNDSVGDAGTSIGQGSSGVKNLEQDLKKVGSAAESAADAVRETANEAKKLDSVSIDINDGNINDIKNALRSMNVNNTDIEKATQELNKLNIVAKNVSATFKDNQLIKIDIKGIETAEDGLKRVVTITRSLGKDGWSNSTKFSQPFDEGTEAAKRFKKEAETVKNIKYDIDVGNFDNQMDDMYTRYKRLSDANQELRKSVEAVENAYKELNLAADANTGDEVADRERLIRAEKEYAAALEKTNNLIKQQARADKVNNDKIKLQDNRDKFQAKIDAWMAKNSAATKKFGAQLLDLRAKAEKADQVQLNHLEVELYKVDKAADKAGLKMQSFGDQIKSKFKEYMAYFSVAEAFMYVEQALRAMFDTVLEIDTAMTGLYRVTDLTAAQYDTLFDNMISSAKEYGATLNDIINATTDWVRAGFDADTALGLAEVTTMYQHISDLDYDTAAENLITAYNGFKNELLGLYDGDEVAAVRYIADVLNELDNNFAVTSAGLGEALKRSASALDLAGNSIQETAG